MRYNVAQLLKGPIGGCREYELGEEVSWLDEELEVIRPLTGSVTFTRTSQGILVMGQLRTMLRGACRRCLEPCDLVVEIDLEEEFHPTQPIGQGSVDKVPDEDDDEALLIGERHILDLSEVVRQGLWLVAPSQALCRPDCAGLCPHCGGNRGLGECHCDEAAVDPRWTVLQTLLSDQSDSLERSE